MDIADVDDTVPKELLVPAAASVFAANVPELIVTAPLKVLFPDRVSVPFPAFVIPKPDPLITAETVNPSAGLVTVNVRLLCKARFPLIAAFYAPPVELTLPPMVRVPVPVVTIPPSMPLFTVSAPIASEEPFRS